ncbi:MAG: glycosyltransferase family 4 protein [Planctomycetota bacterium]
MSQPITVCHPVWQLARGGLERQLLEVLRRLDRRRFRHVLVVRGWNAESDAACRDLGENVSLVRQPARKRDRFWSLNLASILREHAADLLHVRGMSMLLDSLLAARMCRGVSVAFSFHGFEDIDKPYGGIRRRLYRAALARCDARWAVGSSAAASIAKRLKLPPGSFDVVANGVDTDRFSPSDDRATIRRRLELPADRFIVLTVGNLKPIKGHDVLLKAVRKLGADADRMTFVLVGRDYAEGKLRRRADTHLRGRDIRFVGEQQDVLPYYQAADAFVLPSLWEGLSNALLEAMSCGLPAVATAVGGNRDLIEDGRTGLLVEPNATNQLAAAIRSLIADEANRATMAEAGRQEVLARFSLSKMIDAYAARYAALARPAGGGIAVGATRSPATSGSYVS